MRLLGTDRAGRTRCVALVLILLAAGPAPAQTTRTWDGGGGTNDWLTAANWNPDGVPGVAGSTGNTDLAVFATLGSSITAANLNSGFNLGAIAATGASGGLVTTNFSGNGALRLNGGYTVGSFTNVAGAAQNGRDLIVTFSNMSFAFGTAGNQTTFYADAGRVLAFATQQVTNNGGTVNKEGAGTLIWGGSTLITLNADGNLAAFNINGGTFASRDALNNFSQFQVAGGASLQAGLGPQQLLATNATVNFQTNSSLKIVTDGTNVSELDNAAVTKAANDVFQINLTGLAPSAPQTYTPNHIIVQASSLTGFDPNGTYTLASPGHFSVTGDGFLVTNWSVTVLNNTQIRLDSFGVTPVPEPTAVFGVSAIGLVVVGWARRRWDRRPGATPAA
ncbi:MAG TPA: hypothetical protein VGF55_27625 [Gemmataceae bacterium]|jgi:hypothetical protein